MEMTKHQAQFQRSILILLGIASLFLEEIRKVISNLIGDRIINWLNNIIDQLVISIGISNITRNLHFGFDEITNIIGIILCVCAIGLYLRELFIERYYNIKIVNVELGKRRIYFDNKEYIGIRVKNKEYGKLIDCTAKVNKLLMLEDHGRASMLQIENSDSQSFSWLEDEKRVTKITIERRGDADLLIAYPDDYALLFCMGAPGLTLGSFVYEKFKDGSLRGNYQFELEINGVLETQAGNVPIKEIISFWEVQYTTSTLPAHLSLQHFGKVFDEYRRRNLDINNIKKLKKSPKWGNKRHRPGLAVIGRTLIMITDKTTKKRRKK